MCFQLDQLIRDLDQGSLSNHIDVSEILCADKLDFQCVLTCFVRAKDILKMTHALARAVESILADS